MKTRSDEETLPNTILIPFSIESIPKVIFIRSLTTSKTKSGKKFISGLIQLIIQVRNEQSLWQSLKLRIHKRQRIEQSFHEDLGTEINHFFVFLMSVMFQAFFDGFSTSLQNFSSTDFSPVSCEHIERKFVGCGWKLEKIEFPRKWREKLKKDDGFD